jgi:hypothetical protein
MTNLENAIAELEEKQKKAGLTRGNPNIRTKKRNLSDYKSIN